jgi:hypothetical protein
MTERGLSERRALAVVGMSASAWRYAPGPDRNAAMRARIVALAHHHRRYGVGIIRLKLRQAGERVDAKRVHWLSVEQRLRSSGGGATRSRSPTVSPRQADRTERGVVGGPSTARRKVVC